jgi:hypothetical protein
MQSGRDVGRTGDAVARRCKEDARGRKDTIVQEGRVFLEGEKHVVTKGTPAHAIWTPQQHGTTNWPRKFFLR